MTPAEILREIVFGSPQRDEAAKELLALVQRIVAGALLEPRSRTAYTIPEAHREDVVAETVVKVIAKSPLCVVGKPDAVCYAYLQTMAVRVWISMHRRCRESPMDDAILAVRAVAPVREHVTHEMLKAASARARTELNEVFRGLLQRRPPATHATLERSWRQVEELVFEEAGMTELLLRDEGLPPEATKEQLKVVRDRVQKRHERLRRGLSDVVTDWMADGTADELKGEQLRQLILFLVRCQRSQTAGV